VLENGQTYETAYVWVMTISRRRGSKVSLDQDDRGRVVVSNAVGLTPILDRSTVCFIVHKPDL